MIQLAVKLEIKLLKKAMCLLVVGIYWAICESNKDTNGLNCQPSSLQEEKMADNSTKNTKVKKDKAWFCLLALFIRFIRSEIDCSKLRSEEDLETTTKITDGIAPAAKWSKSNHLLHIF